MELLLIRHAQSMGPAPDTGLSPAGEAQALALVDRLRAYEPSHLYSSPYARAMATLAPFAEVSGMGITVIHTLRERHLADADLPDWQDHVARSFDDPDYAAPGGESHNALHARLLTGLRELPVAVVGLSPQAMARPCPACFTASTRISALPGGRRCAIRIFFW